jgi:hypothetical protein
MSVTRDYIKWLESIEDPILIQELRNTDYQQMNHPYPYQQLEEKKLKSTTESSLNSCCILM